MSRSTSADTEETPFAYAARLARYISDPSTIRARTLDQWGHAPSKEQCASLRAEAIKDRQEYREEAERRATPMRRYCTSDNFDCGHERSDTNTYYIGNREACRARQKAAQDRLREQAKRKAQAQARWRESMEAERQRSVEQAGRINTASPVSRHLSARQRIIARASELTGLSPADIVSRKRIKPIVHARFAAIHAMRSRGLSTPVIAAAVGLTDHTTVAHALKRADDMMERDSGFRDLCRELVAAGQNGPEPVDAGLVGQFVQVAA